MYAVIKSGGKQHRVSPGDKLKVEKVSAPEGSRVEFDDVRLVRDDSGVKLGTPVVENARVTGTVLSHGRGNKVVVYKMKRRKDYRKKQGHRQGYTLVEIDEVLFGDEQGAGSTSAEPGTGVEQEAKGPGPEEEALAEEEETEQGSQPGSEED